MVLNYTLFTYYFLQPLPQMHGLKVKNKIKFLGFIYVEVHVFILFNISSQEMVKVILNFVHYYKSLYYSKHNCSGPNNSSNVLNLIVLILIKRQQKAVQK